MPRAVKAPCWQLLFNSRAHTGGKIVFSLQNALFQTKMTVPWLQIWWLMTGLWPHQSLTHLLQDEIGLLCHTWGINKPDDYLQWRQPPICTEEGTHSCWELLEWVIYRGLFFLKLFKEEKRLWKVCMGRTAAAYATESQWLQMILDAIKTHSHTVGTILAQVLLGMQETVYVGPITSL